jgi:hypothetical protein
MSEQSSHDPRDRMVREKYFTLRPKPLERWLWRQGLPQAAERVFWLHWEEGMRNRDWCSQLPLRRVASLCCIDPSTVTRAYQLLKTLDLIRRQDPGRDPENPFQQATAITEVRIPPELLTELSRSPNRAQIKSANKQEMPQSRGGDLTVADRAADAAGTAQTSTTPDRLQAAKTAAIAAESLPGSSNCTLHVLKSGAGPAPQTLPTRQTIQAIWGRASAAERSRFLAASGNGATAIEFDTATRLTPDDRAQLLTQLEQMARARTSSPEATNSARRTGALQSHNYSRRRCLSPLELARIRKHVLQSVPGHQAQEILRQVVWAVEEGALQRFDMPLALNIAFKKIREGAWTRPNRMPPNWSRSISAPAALETCRYA